MIRKMQEKVDIYDKKLSFRKSSLSTSLIKEIGGRVELNEKWIINYNKVLVMYRDRLMMTVTMSLVINAKSNCTFYIFIFSSSS